jgi:hypothetical protein
VNYRLVCMCKPTESIHYKNGILMNTAGLSVTVQFDFFSVSDNTLVPSECCVKGAFVDIITQKITSVWGFKF